MRAAPPAPPVRFRPVHLRRPVTGQSAASSVSPVTTLVETSVFETTIRPRAAKPAGFVQATRTAPLSVTRAPAPSSATEGFTCAGVAASATPPFPTVERPVRRARRLPAAPRPACRALVGAPARATKSSAWGLASRTPKPAPTCARWERTTVPESAWTTAAPTPAAPPAPPVRCPRVPAPPPATEPVAPSPVAPGFTAVVPPAPPTTTPLPAAPPVPLAPRTPTARRSARQAPAG